MSKRVRAIIIANGNLLLIHRIKSDQEYWVFPGGGVEPFDTSPKEALKRECTEELGVSIMVNSLYVTDGEESFYLCSIVEGNIGSGVGPEYQTGTGYKGKYILEWIPLKLMGEYNILPKTVKILLESDEI